MTVAGRGFTLVEVLVALATLAIAAGLAYRGTAALVDGEVRHTSEATRWRTLDTVFTRLEALSELKDIRSRPYHHDEPWFPCKENDWVMLADGTMGRVAIQTPEIVQLIVGGGSSKTYPTAEFLNQNPLNLSRNFCVRVTFGIDYQHQAICITEIPQKLRESVNTGLINEGYRDDIMNLNVEFKEVADSSLDYLISVECYRTNCTRLLQTFQNYSKDRFGNLQ